MVKEMAFFAYSVRDVPKARAFYRDVLGLKEGEMASDHWVEFDVGNVTFGVGNGESLGFPPGKSSGASFEVDDIHEMREQLIKGDVAVGEVNDFPNCYVFFTSDLEGNKFAIHQRKS